MTFGFTLDLLPRQTCRSLYYLSYLSSFVVVILAVVTSASRGHQPNVGCNNLLSHSTYMAVCFKNAQAKVNLIFSYLLKN